jgi:peptidyl-prolyl cis-trans isomerase B (cyclophilin B)
MVDVETMSVRQSVATVVCRQARARAPRLGAIASRLVLPVLMQALVQMLTGLAPVLADKANPDFVPPEITLPMGAGYAQPQATSSQPAPGQAGAGQAGRAGQGGQTGQGYPGFQMPTQLGGTPGIGGAQMNPFLMKGADRLRQPPGTHFASKGMSAPGAEAVAPAAGSSAYGGPQPVTPGNPMPQNGQPASLSTQVRMADPSAVIATSKGNITVMLFRQYAPRTVAAFMEMVKSGFYNGLTFHRVEPGFVIQGGDPNGNGTGDYIPPGSNQARYLPLEVSPSVSHNAAGVLAMARKPGLPNSASCQFYITLQPQPKLDGQYTVFGGVTDGMEVVKRITKGDQIISITVSQ